MTLSMTMMVSMIMMKIMPPMIMLLILRKRIMQILRIVDDNGDDGEEEEIHDEEEITQAIEEKVQSGSAVHPTDAVASTSRGKKSSLGRRILTKFHR